jgi:hypothetical protein
MLKDGICPQCQSQDIYLGQPQVQYEKRAISLPLLKTGDYSATDFLVLEAYICASCGHIEWQVSGKSMYGRERAEALQNSINWQRLTQEPQAKVVGEDLVECGSCGALVRKGQRYCSCGAKLL